MGVGDRVDAAVHTAQDHDARGAAPTSASIASIASGSAESRSSASGSGSPGRPSWRREVVAAAGRAGCRARHRCRRAHRPARRPCRRRPRRSRRRPSPRRRARGRAACSRLRLYSTATSAPASRSRRATGISSAAGSPPAAGIHHGGERSHVGSCPEARAVRAGPARDRTGPAALAQPSDGTSTPGFMIPSGSSRSLTARSAATPSGPASRAYQSRWSVPTPWWWLIVPPASMIASFAAALARAQCASGVLALGADDGEVQRGARARRRATRGT